MRYAPGQTLQACFGDWRGDVRPLPQYPYPNPYPQLPQPFPTAPPSDETFVIEAKLPTVLKAYDLPSTQLDDSLKCSIPQGARLRVTATPSDFGRDGNVAVRLLSSVNDCKGLNF
jgi:hypothetical protein